MAISVTKSYMISGIPYTLNNVNYEIKLANISEDGTKFMPVTVMDTNGKIVKPPLSQPALQKLLMANVDFVAAVKAAIATK